MLPCLEFPMPAIEPGHDSDAVATGETRMVSAPTSESAAGPALEARQVYLMAAICLVLGLGIGYVSRSLQTSPSQAVRAARSSAGNIPSAAGGARKLTLDDMRMMADKQAAPLLARLKSNPSDSDLLAQVAAIYHGSHQFKEAAGYYNKAVQAAPDDVPLRNKLASSLYRSGDVDGALDQLNQGLLHAPKDVNSLFNLGMIRLQGKGDARGALDAWQRLLKLNPQLSAERRAEVQKLMAEAMTGIGNPPQGATGK
jgi:cytochrome c-type biogenesis protein CcmH/NrfG